MKVLKLRDVQEQSQYLRLLVFGEPGTGKTWLGASAALDESTSPVLFVHYRGQIASLAPNPAFQDVLENGRLVVVEVTSFKELNFVYTWLKNGCKGITDLDALFTKPPKTVVIDSLTELQRLEINRRAGNAPGAFVTDPERPQIQDWGKLLDQFVMLARLFFDLPYHIVITALEHIQLDEKEMVRGHRIALQGQARNQVPAYALTVMRLKNAPRNVNAFNQGVVKSAVSRTKDQSGRLPSPIVGPTIPDLVKLLQGGEQPNK